MPDELNMFAFLCLERDKGGPLQSESLDHDHPNEIQVLTYSLGVSNPDAGKAGAGGDKSKSDPHPLVLTTVFSVASPDLFLMAARGDKIKCATISVRKLGAEKYDADYVQIQVCDAYITDYSLSAGDGLRPTETFTLTFQTIDIAYRQQEEDGLLDSPVSRAWSCNDHKAITSKLPYVTP